jgi:seryl-tRNA synthetase
MLEYHLQKHGYTELMVPLAVNRKTMTGTGQLPKLEDDMYHISEDDLFLIPTAEVPVTNFYADEVLSYKDLPLKHVAYTPCFRREAGSYGKDTRGLQRLHQFNKVEMVRFVEPQDSEAALEEMLQDAEDILQAFGLHYRVVSLCTGDLSFASQKTYDLEVWAAGGKKYLEVSSVSNFGEFQARRANIRYKDATGKLNHLHTLNGSGLATPRLMIAILESYQNADGSFNIPEVLAPWMNLKI